MNYYVEFEVGKSPSIIINGTTKFARGQGQIELNHTKQLIVLKDVLYIPDAKCNLFSLKRLAVKECLQPYFI